MGGVRSCATVRRGRGALLHDRLRFAQTIIDTFSARITFWTSRAFSAAVAQERAPPIRVLRIAQTIMNTFPARITFWTSRAYSAAVAREGRAGARPSI